MQTEAVRNYLQEKLKEARVRLEMQVEEQIQKEREQLLAKKRELMKAEVENEIKVEVGLGPKQRVMRAAPDTAPGD